MNTRELGSTPASDPVVTSSKPHLLRSPPWEMIIRIIPLLVNSVEVFRKEKKKGVLCSMQEDCLPKLHCWSKTWYARDEICFLTAGKDTNFSRASSENASP